MNIGYTKSAGSPDDRDTFIRWTLSNCQVPVLASPPPILSQNSEALGRDKDDTLQNKLSHEISMYDLHLHSKINISSIPDSLLLNPIYLLHLGILCDPDFNQFRPSKTTLSILSLIQNDGNAEISVGLVCLYEIYGIFILRNWIFLGHSEERGSVKSGGREPIAAIAIAAGPPEENARTNGTI